MCRWKAWNGVCPGVSGVTGAAGKVDWATTGLALAEASAACGLKQTRQCFAGPSFSFTCSWAAWSASPRTNNKAQAMRVLAARIRDAQVQEQNAKTAATRKSLVGSGDRSERIRTYNFPQGRVTDHRINLTLYKMDAIMDGDIGELTSALMAEHQAEQLAALSENVA